MRYLAIDPGLTTGLAWFDEVHGFESLEIRGRYELYDFVTPLVRRAKDLSVIVERWDVRRDTRSKTNQDDPRYIIGYVDGLCQEMGVRYFEQRPAQAKSFATNDKLKRLGWYTGGEGHADDAARHLLVHLVLTAEVPSIREALV
jgi:hypothetical protein